MELLKNKFRKQFSEDRKFRRTTQFNEKRLIDLQSSNIELNEINPVPLNKPVSRLERLKQYKEQKKQKVELENQSKKPLFKVTRAPTLIKSEIQLPNVKNYHLRNVKSKIDTNLKTRLVQPALKIVPENHQFKVPKTVVAKTMSKKMVPPTSIVTRSQVRKQNANNLEGLRQNITLKNATFFNSLSTSHLLSSTVLFERASVNNSIPFPVLKDISIIKSTPLEKPEKDGVYYEKLLDSEIVRLENRCKCWENIVAEKSSSIPTEILDEIDSSIGQTRLLIKKKFEQFRGLTRGNCEKKITSDDLQGFWDMIYMQVENLDKRFSNLEDKKANNWEEKENLLTSSNNKIKKRDQCIKRRIKAESSSGLKEAIAAARKKKLELLSTNCNEFDKTESFVNTKKVIGAVHTNQFELQNTENNDSPIECIRTVSASLGLKEAIAGARKKKQNLQSVENNISTLNFVKENKVDEFKENKQNESKEINNSQCMETLKSTSKALETNRLTRRQAFAKSKQEKIDETQTSFGIENTSQDNSTINKSSSYVRNKIKRGIVYNLLYGKSDKPTEVVPPIILTRNESSTDNPTNEFNAGFFTILSPHKKPNTSTPRLPHVRKSLLSDKKRNASPGLFMMRASFGAKIAELNTSIEKCSIDSENSS